jgi:hypothetical protein
MKINGINLHSTFPGEIQLLGTCDTVGGMKGEKPMLVAGCEMLDSERVRGLAPWAEAKLQASNPAVAGQASNIPSSNRANAPGLSTRCELEQLALRGKLTSGRFRSIPKVVSGQFQRSFRTIPKVFRNDSKRFQCFPMDSNHFFKKIVRAARAIKLSQIKPRTFSHR